jgi:hypothetical protein
MTPASAQNTHYPLVESAIDKIVHWLHQHAKHEAAQMELASCGCEEVARIAHDFGLSSGELMDAAGRGPHAADELPRMMATLGIDPAYIDKKHPALMRDLQRVCGMCKSKTECDNDLAAGQAAAHYHEYCVNAETLDDLKNR